MKPTTVLRKRKPASQPGWAVVAPARVGAEPGGLFSPAVQLKRVTMLERIVSAATRHLNRSGFTNTTMETVAADLGVLPGALYHYVRDKQELAYLCFQRGMRLRLRQLQEADEPGLEGLEKVRRYLRGVLRTGHPRMPVFSEVHSLEEAHRREIFGLVREANGLLRGYLEQGMADGSIVRSDSRLTTLAISSIVGWISFWYSRRLGQGPEQTAEWIEDLVAHGIYRRDRPRLQFPDPAKAMPLAYPALEDPAELRRDAILRTAMQLLNRLGYAGTSVERVAAEIGGTRGTVYHYFENKDELVREAMRRAETFQIATVAQLPAAGTVAEFELWARRRLFEGHVTPAGPLRTFSVLVSLSAEHRAPLLPGIDATIQRDLERIRLGISSGLYRPVDPYVAERVRAGLFSWFPVWFSPGGRLPALAVADNHTELFLFGLKPRLGEAQPRPAPDSG